MNKKSNKNPNNDNFIFSSQAEFGLADEECVQAYNRNGAHEMRDFRQSFT